MDEIKRLQQLAGINEIKVNNPNIIQPNQMIMGQKYGVTWKQPGLDNKYIEIEFRGLRRSTNEYRLGSPQGPSEIYLSDSEIIKITKI
jgi:hypothetical protein